MNPADLTCQEVRDVAGLYVLAALQPAEMAAVRRHVATCSEPHPEIAELGGVVPALALLAQPIEPRPEMRGRIMAAISATRAEVGSSFEEPRPRPVAKPPMPSRADARRPRSWLAWGALAVAAAMVIALVGWNVTIQGELSSSRSDAVRLAAALAAARQVGTITADVRGTGSAAGASGFVVMPPSGARYLVITGLAPAPTGRTYQAWFITNGAAASAGTFQVSATGVTVWDGISPPGAAQTFALTIEAPGATQPTMQPIALATLRP